MKLTIYDGSARPAVAVGKNQVHALSFAEKFRGWHTYAKDRATLNAIKRLCEKGAVETNSHGQFRFKENRHTMTTEKDTIRKDYGACRSFAKVNIFVKGKYVASTTWAVNCKEAKAVYLNKNPELKPGDVKCQYQP